MAKIKGNKKNNKLKGSAQNDKIKGLAGDDKLKGKGLDDKLIAGTGNDVLDGGTGNDVMKGGAGDDFFEAGEGNDLFDGGAGIDTISFAKSAFGIDVELLTMTSTFDGIQDAYSGIENIDGSAFGDSIEGDASANHFQGFLGNDSLKGGDGNDILDGGEGNDILEGGAGADQLIGGNGFDSVTYFHETSGVGVFLWGAASTGAALGDTFSGIEQVSGTIYSDVIQGDAGANYLYGLAGIDVINGREGNDVIDGGDGADILDGGDGDDHIYAADETVIAADGIIGGANVDTVDYYGAMSGVTADLTGALASAGAAAGDSFTLVENVLGSYYNDILRPGAGGSAFGDRGQDQIHDVLGSSEILRGGRDADMLLDSDAVRDYFVLENYGDGSFDAVHNFNADGGVASDQFWLPKNMFAGLGYDAQGVLGAAYFANNDSATANHAQIFRTGAGAIWFDADGTGSTAAVQIAQLNGGSGTMSNLTFVLVDI